MIRAYAQYAGTNITNIDEYVQALADIPQTQTDPFSIVWPTLSKE